MTIWVDGDSAPRDIRPILVRRSASIPVRFVSARKLPDVPPALATLVPAGPDAADLFIEENIALGDLVVTRDIPFAERLAESGIAAINDHGELYTKENASERRSLRDAAAELRFLGMAPSSPKGSHRTAKETKQFADGLDRALAALRKLNH
ncbi:MAG TPA: DUF188 domain-containing protein [Rectinemataceae bacterium]|nr:DUF188 domain-containing protein [Rectinemataceae bacterium]